MKNKFKLNDKVKVLTALKNNGGFGIVQSCPKKPGEKYLIAMNRSYSVSNESDLEKWVD